jgi:Na+/proline symporter
VGDETCRLGEVLPTVGGQPRKGKVVTVQWDLGLYGLGVLLVMSLAFGVIAQIVFWRVATQWLWLVGAIVYFVSGLLISEVWFGWATEVDLQPNIDGLSFDEVLLFGLVPGIVAVLVTWYLTRHTHEAIAA